MYLCKLGFILLSMKKFVLALLPCVVAACGSPVEEKSVLDLTDLNTSVSPAEDFYEFSTGGWRKKHPLKPEYSRYGVMDVLAENNQNRLNNLFKSMSAANAIPGSVEQKISDLYKMGLDSVRLNKEGSKPLEQLLGQIMAVSNRRSLTEILIEMHSSGDYAFFAPYVMADMTDGDMQVLYLQQSGLGMSDRDYYLDESNAEIKAGYRSFLEKIFTLSGIQDAAKVADDALAVEGMIAKAQWSSVELRDVPRQYNPMSSDELESNYPNLDFGLYFRLAGIPRQSKIIVGQPSYFAALDSLMSAEDFGLVKSYLAGQFVQGACNALSDSFYTASFDFFQKQMAGVQVQKPRWKRAVSVPNELMSEAVGKVYVSKYFSSEDKARVKEMVANLQKSLKQHIEELDWMSDSTKSCAIDKLGSFTVKIGYPDKWKDYSTLIINPTLSYYENIRNASKWHIADNMSRLGKKTDKEEWLISPQTVNAYYNPPTNEICFPAAILQPPFYDSEADDAVNYGAIGVVISHEMTHGFDDQGRMFDKNGNMTDWWTEADVKAFNSRADKLIAQFDSVQILPGIKANGALCIGENIADQGGLRIAFTALSNSFGDVRPENIDGYTPEQRFYLSYGRIWAQNITDEEKARLTKLDVHSLGENRVNVTLRNLQTFFDAFGIKEGDPMYRPEEDRVIIW